MYKGFLLVGLLAAAASAGAAEDRIFQRGGRAFSNVATGTLTHHSLAGR